ncbi:hypothetical protein MTO96_048589 [Rhipicephalus appendiculatus]
MIPEVEYCFHETEEHRCMCAPWPPPHSACQTLLHEEMNGQWLPCDPIYYSRECHHAEMLPIETIAAQQVTFPGIFVVEALTTTEDGSRVTHPPSPTFSFESKGGQIGSWTKQKRKVKAAATSPFSGSGSSGGQSAAAKGGGRRIVRGPDSTAPSISSLAPNWMPEELKRYFRKYSRKSRGGGSPRHSSPRRVSRKRKTATSPERPPSSVTTHHGFLALLAVVVTMLLVGVSADLYATLSRGDGRRPHRDTPAPLEPFQKNAEATFSAARHRNDEATGFVKDRQALAKYPARPAQRAMKSTVHSPFHITKSSAEETTEEISVSSASSDNEGEVTRPGGDADTAGNMKAAALNETHTQSPCGAFAFTFCESPLDEFFYKRSVNACVAVAADTVGLCISGRNRFTSKRSCRQTCVDVESSPEHCLVDAVFRKCEKQDVTGVRWHFDGRSCLEWNFTSGLCPSYHSDVFSSQHDCWTNCLAKPRKRLCRAATPDVCYSAHLRFPYFAAGGSVAQCLKVSSLSYPGRRCLVGSFYRQHEQCVRLGGRRRRSSCEGAAVGVARASYLSAEFHSGAVRKQANAALSLASTKQEDINTRGFSRPTTDVAAAMDVSCTHLWLLVWKCYVIVVKRHWVAFVMELVAPAAVSLTLVFARQNMEYARVRNVTHFEPFSLQRLPPRFHVPPPSASRWLLLYAPETNATRAVLEALAENSNPPLAAQGFETEESMVDHYTAATAHRDSILGGVVFVGLSPNASGTLPLDIHFKASIASSQRRIGADFDS